MSRDVDDYPLHGGLEVHRIGDCLSPRRAHAAVLGGHQVGLAL